MKISTLLQQNRLLVVLGHGGVGKTTVSATLGIQAASLGLKTAVITIDPANRLADVFDNDAPMTTLTPIEISDIQGSLHAMMLDRKYTCDELVKRFSTDHATHEKTLSNPYYKHFSTSLAGGQEYMAIETVYRQLESEDFDLIILDTPPSAHAFDFLDAPKRLINGIKRLPTIDQSKPGGFARRLREKGGAIVLDGLRRFTGGRFLTDLTNFLGLFKHVLFGLARASEQLEGILRSETTAFIYVELKSSGATDRIKNCRQALMHRNLTLNGVVFNRTPMTIDEAILAKSRNRIVNALHAARSLKIDDDLITAVSQTYNLLYERQYTNQTENEFVVNNVNAWTIPLKRGWVSTPQTLKSLGDEITPIL